MNHSGKNIDLDSLFSNPTHLKHHIRTALHEFSQKNRIYSENIDHALKASSVLFILGSFAPKSNLSSETCLILNKRSVKVRQPGDLCCPGGGISSRTDRLFSKFLHLPGSPLTRWPYWRNWRQGRRMESGALSVLLAGALREGLEEMRLNPFGLDFLGPLPSQQLAMFQRIIYPMACWVSKQRKFYPNWEVERLVYIPLRRLLNPSNYAVCRMKSHIPRKACNDATVKDFPCFIHDPFDLLWGATFRITMAFLNVAFGFNHPDMKSLPVVQETLGSNYLTGNRI
jgi:hypothetical protein